jgi:hypothetical protein
MAKMLVIFLIKTKGKGPKFKACKKWWFTTSPIHLKAQA